MRCCTPAGRFPALAAAAGIITASIVATAVAQRSDDTDAPAQPEREQTRQQQRGGPGGPGGQGAGNFAQMLVNGLKDTEGCLGVEVAQMQVSGMNTIIAWFENKAAAERWYYSPTHRFTMGAVGADADAQKPLAGITDEDAPLMVMASIKPVGEGEDSAIPGPMPVSAISIEIYQPMPGGAAIKARLMPEEIEIEGFKWMGGGNQPAGE